MEDFGYIKGATGHRDILHMSDGGEGKMRGMKGGGGWGVCEAAMVEVGWSKERMVA